MKLSSLNTNQKLAGVALVLGVVAVVGEPFSRDTVKLDTRELGLIVENEVDHITAAELSDWIIQGRADYRLIDLREPEAYTAYHIPTAESAMLTQLPDYGLSRNEKVVLYSEGGIHAAQAWMLLKAQGYKAVYMVLGGLDAWKEEVLFPTHAETASPEQKAQFERRSYVSKFFGGTPQSGTAAASEASSVVMPKMQMPTVPATPPAAPQTKKRREGC